MRFPKLNSKLMLAPMAGYSDVAFRLLCKKYGAGMCFTELTSAEAIVKGKIDVAIVDDERPVGLQLFGNDVDMMIEAGKKFEKKCDVLDVNMGCPSVKIMQGGYGAALLKEKVKIKEIVKGLVDNVKLPISVKIRNCKDVISIAKIIEKTGASVIVVHGRTVGQGYSGKANWDVIKKVKENVNMLVVGNGDVGSVEDANKMMQETGCDYVMVGRATLRNPCLFRGEKRSGKEMFFEYLELAKKYHIDFKVIKNHALLFTKGVVGGAGLREEINKCKDLGVLEKAFGNL